MISLLDFIVLFTVREKKTIYRISHFESILNKISMKSTIIFYILKDFVRV